MFQYYRGIHWCWRWHSAIGDVFSEKLVYVFRKIAEVKSFPNPNHKNCVIQNFSKHFDLSCSYRVPGFIKKLIKVTLFLHPVPPYTLNKSKVNIYTCMLLSSPGVTSIIDPGFTTYNDVAWYAVSLHLSRNNRCSIPLSAVCVLKAKTSLGANLKLG